VVGEEEVLGEQGEGQKDFHGDAAEQRRMLKSI
jgi:hypothetical protein